MIDNNAFNNLPLLHKIVLDNNNLEVIQSNTFNNLPNLAELNISNNNTVIIQPNSFINLPKLKIIKLNENKLQVIKTNTFMNLPEITNIYLNNNNIVTIETNAFGHNIRELATVEPKDGTDIKLSIDSRCSTENYPPAFFLSLFFSAEEFSLDFSSPSARQSSDGCSR